MVRACVIDADDDDDDSAVNDIRSGSSRLFPDRTLRGGTVGGGASDPLLAEFGKLLEPYAVDEWPLEPGRGLFMANVLYAKRKEMDNRMVWMIWYGMFQIG